VAFDELDIVVPFKNSVTRAKRHRSPLVAPPQMPELR
jgi:hypothetical protein